MYYIFVENNELNGCGQAQCTNEDIQNIEVSEEIYNAYSEDNIRYIWNGAEIIENPDYEQEKQKREKERIANLYMTRSDFFDNIIMAFGLEQKELRAIIEQILNKTDITNIEIKIALNNYDNALNFYRKHTLFTLLNKVEIPISDTMTLLFTDDIWDKFFDTKNYKELQKAIKK